MNRIESEKRTVSKMIRLYCRLNHHADSLCPECRELLEYASLRLDKCKYGIGKTACSECTVHCYHPEMKERVKLVMRFSGPRMILYHPLELLRYLIRKVKPKRKDV